MYTDEEQLSRKLLELGSCDVAKGYSNDALRNINSEEKEIFHWQENISNLIIRL